MNLHIEIYTASECPSNPGPGGYAAIIDHHHRIQQLAGRDTNAEAEKLPLIAALEALKSIPDGSITTVISTSALASHPNLNRWLQEQNDNAWLTQDGSHIQYHPLWREIFLETQSKAVTWTTPAKPHDQRTQSCIRAAQRQAEMAQQDLHHLWEIQSH